MYPRLSVRALLLLVMAPLLAHAQSEWGNITGVVTDPAGAVVPGAEVSIISKATNAKKTTVSGSGGQYNVPVPPGAYQVEVGLPGFKSFRLGESRRFDFRWEIFNLFNRTVFGTGNTNLNNNSFGVVTSQVNDPRQMQVGLKLYW